MNNAIYERTMENLRNRINVKLVNNEKISKLALKLNKPAYIGMCSLELSKISY